MALAYFPGCQSAFKLSAYRGGYLAQRYRAINALQMSKIMGGGIVKALAVWLQPALAFHRHIGEGTRERGGLLAKALDREIALRGFRFCLRSSIEPSPDSFTTRTTQDIPTSTHIWVRGLFNLELADRSSALPLQDRPSRGVPEGKKECKIAL
jgi:hypothetical protein